MDTTSVILLFAFFGLAGDLYTTRQRLKSIDFKLQLLLRHPGIDPLPLPLPVSDRVKQLAADPQQKIQAIKALREETGLGLKEAKDIVERLAWEHI